jgi:pimeloyl-ACP methyl ester carboxylesterase
MNTRTLQVDGIDIHLEGEGPQTIVMIHGWPDTYRLWDAQVEALAPHWRCARFTLPGFDAEQPRAAPTLDEMTRFIERVVDAVSPGKPIVLMLHDWGCVFGYEYALRHPERIARLVAVDVGDTNSKEFAKSLAPKQGLFIAAYQLYLALAWALGGRLGDGMTRRMAMRAQAPSDRSRIRASMNYPYAMRWFGARGGGFKHARPLTPAWPTLFIWGTRKLARFHSPQWMAALQARPDCRIVSMKAGHWMMVTHPQEFNAAVLGWLGEPAA